jgi:hypothetical protein
MFEEASQLLALLSSDSQIHAHSHQIYYRVLMEHSRCYIRLCEFGKALRLVKKAIEIDTTLEGILALSDCYKGLNNKEKEREMMGFAQRVRFNF